MSAPVSPDASRANVRLCVGGGAGVGKSALIARLIGDDRDAAGRGFLAAEGQNGHLATAVGDVCIIVVDAAQGLCATVRQHAAIARTVGFRHLVLAVNKLDLVGWNELAYTTAADALREFAGRFDFATAVAIPVSALHGDNVARPSAQIPWYQGPTLKAHLDETDIDPGDDTRPLRLPISSVSRPDRDRRLYSGVIASGTLKRGDAVQVATSGVISVVDHILVDGVGREAARAGDQAAVGLVDHVDLGSGDMLAHAGHRPQLAEQFAAHLAWMAEEPLFPGREYKLRLASQELTASVTAVKYRIDVDTLRREAARTLDRGEIGACTIATVAPLAVDDFSEFPQTGRFVLSDRYTDAVIAAGTVDFALRRGMNIHLQALSVSKDLRASIKGQQSCIVWFTGLSGAGKSTIANLVERDLAADGRHTYLLDGDNVRHGLNKDLGFTAVDRVENIRRVGEVARLFVDAGTIVLCSFISPFRAERAAIRSLVEPAEFIEVYVKAPLDVCETRDPKGLYAKCRAGRLPNFTGIDSPYEAPEAPDLVLDTTSATAEELAQRVAALLQSRGIIAAPRVPLTAVRRI